MNQPMLPASHAYILCSQGGLRVHAKHHTTQTKMPDKVIRMTFISWYRWYRLSTWPPLTGAWACLAGCDRLFRLWPHYVGTSNQQHVGQCINIPALETMDPQYRSRYTLPRIFVLEFHWGLPKTNTNSQTVRGLPKTDTQVLTLINHRHDASIAQANWRSGPWPDLSLIFSWPFKGKPSLHKSTSRIHPKQPEINGISFGGNTKPWRPFSTIDGTGKRFYQTGTKPND